MCVKALKKRKFKKGTRILELFRAMVQLAIYGVEWTTFFKLGRFESR